MTKQTTAILERLNGAMSDPSLSTAPQFVSDDAPFDEVQRTWLNGLFTGLYAISMGTSKSAAAETVPATALTVLYGSQSGTCESLSKDLRKFSKTHGFEARLAELDSVSLEELSSVQHLLILAATFGEGEPTDNARTFYEALMAENAPALPASLHYSVCGLGDSSYVHFNKAAKDIDARLGELGATRVREPALCDVAFEDSFAEWKQAVFKTDAFMSAAGAAQAPEPEAAGPRFDKNSPFLATLLTARCLSAEASAKRVNHVEISLAGGGEDLDYKVGDALGVWPVNDMADVNALLEAAGLTGAESIDLKSGPTSLRAALLTRLDLATVTPDTMALWAPEGAPQECQVIDLLRAGIADLTAQGLADALRPLQPRLYSISSSPSKHPGEVHLTVGEVHYTLNGTARKGVASTYLGGRLGTGANVGVYVQRSSHFHLPDDDTQPVIMIGPGTGIAPFRAFLEEREMRRAPGDNWLFFGDQHEATDHLYRDEIEAWQESGHLTRTSLAWSRDTSQKVYVQHLIEKEGALFYEWLERGAAIYVCGDASRMAQDVDTAIRSIVALHGNMAPDQASAYVDALSKSHRYQRDVY